MHAASADLSEAEPRPPRIARESNEIDKKEVNWG